MYHALNKVLEQSKDPCPHEAYIVVGKQVIHNKLINYIICQKVMSDMGGKKVEQIKGIRIARWGRMYFAI